jgi:calcineurin-like phosphoesterase family protein
MKNWLITDTHFNHEKIKALAGRPDNYQDLIIKNWCAVVATEDIVIHLGDVIFSRQSELSEIIMKLPGRKILVRGNHDHEKNHWYIERGFDFVCDSFTWRDILFTHIPVKIPDGIRLNVHGHFHNDDHRSQEESIQVIYDEEKHRLLAIEKTNYKPVLLDDVIK